MNFNGYIAENNKFCYTVGQMKLSGVSDNANLSSWHSGFAGMGAGLGTGFAGMSAAAVISPMLITFLDMDAYMAVGIALSSDVLASAVSAYTYGKNKNLDIKNGQFSP